MKKIIVITITSLILTGCFNKEENINPEIKNNINVESKGLTAGSNMVFEEKKVEVKMKNEVLTIKNKLTIKEGRADDFPKDFNIIKGGKIYQNSNMQKYAFIIVKNQTIETISDYYKKELKLNGWKLYINNEEENINNKIQKVEDIKKTSNSLKFIKNIGENQISELNLDINSDIPKILKENFNFEGKFIEIRFNDLFTQPEISN
ncbi:MAG: hypothetical protein WC850_03760 [Candidatus Gracilibacteria bacterium]